MLPPWLSGRGGWGSHQPEHHWGDRGRVRQVRAVRYHAPGGRREPDDAVPGGSGVVTPVRTEAGGR